MIGKDVLILVLVEDGLGEHHKLHIVSISVHVLILVVVEDGLGVHDEPDLKNGGLMS